MKPKTNETSKQTEQQPESDPLMAVYNPAPPQPEQPTRFYWQPCDEGDEDCVQAAFEN